MDNIDNWQIQNENPNHWSFNDNVLTMQVQEGNLYGADSPDVDNLFILPLANPNYSAEITVNIEPVLPYEQAGLGIYWDKNNYIKLSREMFLGEHSLVFVVEQNGKPEVIDRISYINPTVSIKFQKIDELITVYFRSNNESTWQTIGSVKALAGSEKGIMLYTFSGSPTRPNFAKFSGFQLEM